MTQTSNMTKYDHDDRKGKYFAKDNHRLIHVILEYKPLSENYNPRIIYSIITH